ncbi:GDP-6-deoxy-D-lyxo-4-hexulose reductase [Betaproteobacteria bacterium]|nr:GDP-6-deoxy-D-lyxo-4-hexulose reductase [Betaproteobacteria bacterium]
MAVALITGIAGFTGHYLTQDLLARGYRVVGLDQTRDELIGGASPSADRVASYPCDLMDRVDLAKAVRRIEPDVVVHLAAISFVAHGDAEAIYRINVAGTRNLLEVLSSLEKKPSAVLLASSANIYGNSTLSPIDESMPPNPANDYAVSKLAMEYMARLWMDRLPIVTVRPFNYTGVGQAPQFLLPKIVGHFQRGEKIIELGNIDIERDFSDVRFVSRAYCELLQKAPAGQVFNICSGNVYSLKDVLRMMAELAGYEIEVRVNPAFVRDNEVKRLEGSNRRLFDVIGELCELPVIPLRETLAWMLRGAACQ